MKNKLITNLQELLDHTSKVNHVGIKVSIMENTAFLANQDTAGEISNIMKAVNSYIDFPNKINKANVERVIQHLDEKF